MNIIFVAGFAPISRNPSESNAFYVDQLGLPLRPLDGDYVATEDLDGAKHLGVWPLAQVAQTCFGTTEWPENLPVPQATIEFEVDDVPAAAAELEAQGHNLLHGPKTEPWGQTITRLLGPEGLLIGLAHTPHLHQDSAS